MARRLRIGMIGNGYIGRSLALAGSDAPGARTCANRHFGDVLRGEFEFIAKNDAPLATITEDLVRCLRRRNGEFDQGQRIADTQRNCRRPDLRIEISRHSISRVRTK